MQQPQQGYQGAPMQQHSQPQHVAPAPGQQMPPGHQMVPPPGQGAYGAPQPQQRVMYIQQTPQYQQAPPQHVQQQGAPQYHRPPEGGYQQGPPQHAGADPQYQQQPQQPPPQMQHHQWHQQQHDQHYHQHQQQPPPQMQQSYHYVQTQQPSQQQQMWQQQPQQQPQPQHQQYSQQWAAQSGGQGYGGQPQQGQHGGWGGAPQQGAYSAQASQSSSRPPPTYVQGQVLEVIRSSGEWHPCRIREVNFQTQMYTVDVLHPETLVETGIWKEILIYADGLLRPRGGKSYLPELRGGKGAKGGAGKGKGKGQDPPSEPTDPDLEDRLNRKLRELEARSGKIQPPVPPLRPEHQHQPQPQQHHHHQHHYHQPQPQQQQQPQPQPQQQQQQQQSGLADPTAHPAPATGAPGHPTTAGSPPRAAAGRREVAAPGGGTMDADLNARIEARLRKAEEMAADNQRQREQGMVIHADHDPAQEQQSPGSDHSTQPNSEDDAWVEEQLGPEEEGHVLEEVDVPPVETHEEVVGDHQRWLEQQQAAGLVVRGVCPMCSFEVLNDMPRFKLQSGQYVHEACRDAAHAAGHEGVASTAAVAEMSAQSGSGGAPAADGVDEQLAQMRAQVAQAEQQAGAGKPQPAPSSGSPKQAGGSPRSAQPGP